MTEEDSFREFVEVRYGELLRTAFLLTGSTHAAEDLVQSALLKVYRAWTSIEDPVPYLRRVMVNQHISLWRRISSRELISGAVPEPVTPDPAVGAAQRAELLDALSRLPKRMRTVLVLRFWEDLSEAETAQIMGCSVGTVKSQASRGLIRLRDVLQEEPSFSGHPKEALA